MSILDQEVKYDGSADLLLRQFRELSRALFGNTGLGKPARAEEPGEEKKMPFKFKGKGKKASNIVRLTSLFPLKGKTGSIGSVTDEYFDRLVEVIEKAVDQGNGVTFFYNKWKPGENPTLSVAVAEPYTPKASVGKARDEEEVEVEEEQEEEE